jgi:acetyl-CoA carboxylase biotin carboxylase subunit
MKKILVANRGEIALRIMRSAREMGIKTVSVFSEADRNAPFVRYADESVCIGPPPSNQSYLNIDKIIEVCKQLHVDGVHPGYGFLSERPIFAKRLKEAGITLIGPSAEAMEVMGDKLSAKEAVKKYNIPLVPGSEGAISDVNEALEAAKKAGFPVLIKAAAGGGGKGMRLIENPENFKEEMNRAISEAQSAFGDGAVFVEKFVEGPRHVEIQVLADNFGNVVYLFERECSIQRRHQKVVEEAPSSVLTPEMRKAMGECAVNVCKACNYSGAGTVEFLVDVHRKFYFLEMNTRLQVEHPVSEMITGIDLVKEQIKVAMNLPLSFTQDDLKINGHALEIRVYAEDLKNNFLPDIGKLSVYKKPDGNGVRVDDGFEEGMDIPIYYDPMIAKLVTHGKDRNEAIEKMVRAIDEYQIVGVENTLKFCRFAILSEPFKSGNFDTNFVKLHFKPEYLMQHNAEEEKVAAMVATFLFNQHATTSTTFETSNEVKQSNWKRNRTK